MFAKLTGTRSAENVVLVTTMWDTLKPTFVIDCGKREQGLKAEFCRVMIPHHIAVERFLNDSISAWSIVDRVVKNDDRKNLDRKFQVQPMGTYETALAMREFYSPREFKNDDIIIA